MNKATFSWIVLGFSCITIIPMLMMFVEHMDRGQYSMLQGLLDEIVI